LKERKKRDSLKTKKRERNGIMTWRRSFPKKRRIVEGEKKRVAKKVFRQKKELSSGP